VISVTDLSADLNDCSVSPCECVVNQMENTMANNRSHDDIFVLSFGELADAAGGTSPIQVVMDAYNAALKDMAAQQKDAMRSYVALGSANHPL
jgi:hypothetical protein